MYFKILVIQFMQMIGFKVLVTAGLLLIGGALVLNQEMNIGQFVAAEIIILLVITSVEKLILGLESFYDVVTSIEKIGQVVDKRLEPQEGEKPNFDETLSIELDQVIYKVINREKPILKDITLKVNSKSRILVKGESGSGKSSLIRVLAGVIQPTNGAVSVNNFALESLQLNHFRAHMGLSLSEETPFEGTIRENLTFGDYSVSDDDILWAFEKVGLLEFLKEQPKGLNTILYPEGKQISFTIAKKLVLARAIVKKPKVLILEDALDQFNKEETNKIIDFLVSRKNPWALVVVSSNKRWESYCNDIITLEDGRIKNYKKC